MMAQEGDFALDFSLALRWERFDRKGRQIPQGMSFVDFLVEEPRRILLIEIKDPFCLHEVSPMAHTPPRKGIKRGQEAFRMDRMIHQSLVPKIRDSYTWLHLMEQSDKPFLFIVLLGLDCFSIDMSGLLVVFKDRLLSRIRREDAVSWKIPYVQDCLVLDPSSFRRSFPQYPLFRVAEGGGGDEPGQEICYNNPKGPVLSGQESRQVDRSARSGNHRGALKNNKERNDVR